MALVKRKLTDLVALRRKSVRGNDHPFTGYYLPYPEKDFDGVVSTTNKMNMLNWIYIDTSTYEIKYGVRAEADKHITGPMGILTLQDGEMRLICMQWEGLPAVGKKRTNGPCILTRTTTI